MTSLSTKLVTGDGRLINVASVIDTYRNLVSQSNPISGTIKRLSDDYFSLTARFGTADCDTLESIETFKVYSLVTKTRENSEKHIESVRCVSDPNLIGELLSASSSDGRFLARLKNPQPSSSKDYGSDATKKQLLEIWDRSKLLKTIDTSELDAHGLINTENQFSNFVWSPFGQQDKLLYVCHPKRPKHISFFKDSGPQHGVLDKESGKANKQTASNSTSPLNMNRGEEYIKLEDWGEALNGIEHTIIGVLDVSSNCQITTIEAENFSLATPQWLDNGSKIVSVAYPELPRKLGLVYYNSRPSQIMIYDWKSSSKEPMMKLKSETECFHTPRVNHSGDEFIYLTNTSFGAHEHAVKLSICNIRTMQVRELIDSETKRSEFFVENLPRNCFTTDDKHILLVTHDHLCEYMCLYSFENSSLNKIKFPTTGLSVYDFRYDIIFASGSKIDTTPTLFVSSLNLSNINDVVAWHQIEDCVHLDEIEYESFKLIVPDESTFVSALLIKPNLRALQENYVVESQSLNEKLVHQNTELPTVVLVHGGPNSTFCSYYMPVVAIYVRLGLKVLLINYRGSTGVSEEYVQSLNGHVGDMDVNDCLFVIRELVKRGFLDKSKLVIQGGSHGGFLSAHLSCQDEFKFSSAILRNPVIDISTLYETSDIPDWCFTVSLGHKNYDPSFVPNSEDLRKMYECSPISRVTKANVPTLMLLGNKDRRVNMYQGERWVDNLRARGVDTLCKVYADKHSLDKVDVAADATITAIIWILSHLEK